MKFTKCQNSIKHAFPLFLETTSAGLQIYTKIYLSNLRFLFEQIEPSTVIVAHISNKRSCYTIFLYLGTPLMSTSTLGPKEIRFLLVFFAQCGGSSCDQP